MQASTDASVLRRRLDAGLTAMAVDLDEQARDRLVAYLRLLNRWNRTYNLTAVRDPQDMVARHLLDSLAVIPYLRGERCLDVGSGAGLPGLVLAVACPAISWVLLDSNAKKCRFLNHARMALRIDNARVERSRVEDFHPGVCFSTIISRALSNLADFVAGAGHLLAPGGCWLAMKGRNPERELPALSKFGGQSEVVPVRLPGLENGQRHLVIVTPADESREGRVRAKQDARADESRDGRGRAKQDARADTDGPSSE
jgi:16S rRNA (guanine527-N7)-methyltransferase